MLRRFAHRSFKQIPTSFIMRILARGDVKVWLAGLLGTVLILQPAAAQTPPTPASPNAARPAVPCPPPNAKMTAVAPTTIQMEDIITVSGDDLKALVTACPGKDVVLFLDWLPLADVKGELVGDGQLRFRLLRGRASKHNWDVVLGRPQLEAKSMLLGIGYADAPPVPGSQPIKLLTLTTRGFAAALLTFAILSVTFVWLAIKSDIIRVGPSATPGTRGAFSLSKSQAAWWFFVVLGAYLLIGIVTGDFTTSFNATALGLLAIGGGTAIGGALITASQNGPETQIKRQAELSRVKTVEATIDPMTAPLRAEAARRAQTVLANASQGFLIDILSDADGVCFHRFQVVAWTIVLTGVFISGVYENLAMPTFDPTLFGLLGLSSLTYLGLKNSEAVVPNTPGLPKAAPG